MKKLLEFCLQWRVLVLAFVVLVALVGVRSVLALPIDAVPDITNVQVQVRVGLARLLLSRAHLWVLDEPYTALDRAAVALLQAMIRNHLARGGLAVLTTHQQVEIDAGITKELRLG